MAKGGGRGRSLMAEIAIGSRVQICAFSGSVSAQESAKRKSGRYVSWAEMDGAEGVVRGASVSSLVVDIQSKDAARSGHITVPVGALKPIPKED